jgi:hypothetical protein
VANALSGTELIVLSADQDQASVTRAWFYLPRLLGPNSAIYQEELDPQRGKLQLRRLTPAEIKSLSGTVERRRAA